MRPGFINSFRPSFRTPLGGGLDDLVLLETLSRTRPVARLLVDSNADPDALLTGEALFADSDINVMGDNRRGFISDTTTADAYADRVYRGFAVERQGTDDGVGEFVSYNCVGNLTPNSSITQLAGSGRWQTINQSANETGVVSGTGVIPPVADGKVWYYYLYNQHTVAAHYNNVSGLSEIRFGQAPGNMTAFTTVLPAGSLARCAAGARGKAFNTPSAAPFCVVGGTASGQASAWTRVGQTATLTQRLLAGTDVDQIMVFQQGVYAGLIILAQPDGVRAYSYSDINGVWSLAWFIAEANAYGLEILPWHDLLISANTKLLIVDPATGTVKASIPLVAGYAPARLAYAAKTSKAFVSAISGGGSGTASNIYTVGVKKPAGAYLPYIPTVYCRMTEAAGAFQVDTNRSMGLYNTSGDLLRYYNDVVGAIIRQPGGFAGVQITSTGQRVSRSEVIFNPATNTDRIIGTYAFTVKADGAAPLADNANVLPRLTTQALDSNFNFRVTRGPSTLDPTDAIRVTSSDNAQINGEGAWAFPNDGEYHHHVFTWSRMVTAWRNTQRFQWWIDGVLQAEISSGSTPLIGPSRLYIGGPVNSALSTWRGPVVFYNRMLTPPEIKALRLYMLQEAGLTP